MELANTKTGWWVGKNATLYENSKIVNDVFARIIGVIFIKVSSRKTDGMGES